MRFHFPFPFSGYLKQTSKTMDKIIEFIGSRNPDIIGLIEIDSGSFRTNNVNQIKHIAKELGHLHVYESKYAESSLLRYLPVLSKQGNAMLTKQDITAKRYHYFRHGIKRLIVEIELNELVVFLIHLSIKFRHRHHQLADLYKIIKDVRKPVIVAGDLNALWGKHELELFLGATGLINANQEGKPTFPSYLPRKQLDFILHTPEIKVTHFEIPSITYSDHLPVICDFEILKKERKSPAG